MAVERVLVDPTLNGAYKMPAFASSSKPDELDALVAFLKTRHGQRPIGNAGSESPGR